METSSFYYGTFTITFAIPIRATAAHCCGFIEYMIVYMPCVFFLNLTVKKHCCCWHLIQVYIDQCFFFFNSRNSLIFLNNITCYNPETLLGHRHIGKK